MEEILKQDTRILRPSEFESLLNAIDNTKHRILILFMFHTGIRYRTGKRFHKHPEWLMNNAIYLPKGSTLKTKARQRERHILLSIRGREVAKDFLQIKHLPTRQGFNKMLKHYCKKANISDLGIKPKMFRKMLESYLIAIKPTWTQIILASLGHTSNISLTNYMTTPFSKDDKKHIKYMLEGWGE